MKPEEFLQTGTEQQAASSRLVRTEQINAVNSGLVQKSDQSDRMLKEPLYKTSHKSSFGKAAVRGLIAQKSKAAPLLTSKEQASEHLKGKSSQAQRIGKAGASEAISSTLEDTELEGADDLAYRGMETVRAVKRIAHPIHPKVNPVEEEKSLGQLSEKKAQLTKKASQSLEGRKKAQAASYAKKQVYSKESTRMAAAQTRQTAGEAARKVTAALTRGIGRFFAALGSLSVPALLLIGVFGGILLLFIVGSGFSSGSNPSNVPGFGDLEGVQLEVAQALAAEGLGPAQIAAIMGNISGESGWDPTTTYHGEGNNYAYEYGYGLYQFTDTQPGSGEYSTFASWCSVNGKQVSSPSAQTEFFVKNLRSSWSTALHRSGYYTKYIGEYHGKDASYDTWLNSGDVGFATYCVMACWLRPADWAARQSFHRDRLPAAQAFYAQLMASDPAAGISSDAAVANPTQKAILNAASSTPSPGAGWCAMWVSNVYAKAGLGYIGGNACDMYASYCHLTDRSQLQPGMLIAVRSASSGTSAGATYGHVGIYIGNGKVIHNIGSIETWDLDRWINYYCKWSPAGWGYPPNARQ